MTGRGESEASQSRSSQVSAVSHAAPMYDVSAEPTPEDSKLLMAGRLEVREDEPVGHCEAIPLVRLASAEQRHVDGDDQRGSASRRGALDQVAGDHHGRENT